MQLIQKLRAVIKKFLAEVVLDDLARGRIDIKSLPGQMRRYVISCLIIICLVIAGTIILYFNDSLLPGIDFSFGENTYTISYLTLVISIIAFILGWTMLLMGGIWSNTITFSILAFFFFYLIGYLGIGGSKTWWPILPLGLVFILLILSLEYSRQALKNKEGLLGTLLLCFIISFFAVRGTALSYRIPSAYCWQVIACLTLLLMCVTWLISNIIKHRFPEERFIVIGRYISIGIIIIFCTIIAKLGPEINQFPERLFTVFDTIRSYISLFWFILGFCALWMVINLAEWSRDALHILFPRRIIITIVTIFWAAIILLNLYPNIRTIVAQLSGVKLHPIQIPYTWDLSLRWTGWAIVGCVLLLYKKLTEARILGLFQLTIFVLLFSQAYYAIQLELIQETEFQLWSLVIFIITITWLLFQGSGFIVNTTGKWFPRSARLFLFFGMILIMAGMNNAMLVAKTQRFINEFRLSAYTGFLYTGPPFILYLWLVKRLKRHPVKPSELAFLFIWGAILAHPAMAMKRGFEAVGIHPYILILVMAVIQEYIKIYVIKKLVYKSPHFNELIDGIIYASCIALGWAIFYLNPQFALVPYPIRIPSNWDITYPVTMIGNAAFLWHYFTIQFACACLLGYGMARTKLYPKGRLFAVLPLILGWVFAVLYRAISEIIFENNINSLFSYGAIWPYTGLSLLIIGIIVTKALGVFRRYLKFSCIMGIGLVLCTGWLLYQKKTITYKEPTPHFQFVVPRSWQKIESPTPETPLILKSPKKDMPLIMNVSLENIPGGLSFGEFTAKVEEVLKSRGVDSHELHGQLINLHGIQMSYYIFTSTTTLPSGQQIELQNACWVFLKDGVGYTILFYSPEWIDINNISPIIQSFRFV